MVGFYYDAIKFELYVPPGTLGIESSSLKGMGEAGSCSERLNAFSNGKVVFAPSGSGGMQSVAAHRRQRHLGVGGVST
jgi:hypothetical protein